MLGRRSLAVSVAVVAVLLAGSYATAAAIEAQNEPSATRTKTIGSVITSDFRVILSAERVGTGEAPTATVMVTTSERLRGTWRRTGAHRLPGTYFWNTVIAPRAICRLELRTAARQARFRPRAIVQLLVTPSIGCGRAVEYVVAR